MILVCSLLLVFLAREVQSQQSTDLGDLSFVCGLQSNGRVSTQNGQNPGSNSLNFRGPKGDAGNPGKQGPAGVPGTQGLRGPMGPQGISSRPAASCLEYLESGNTGSGIYSIKPTFNSATTEVYCDMESAGGGWTLVASVHENDINGKCTIGDNWSSDGTVSSLDYNGLRSWESYNVFGNVESATTGDYKSAAYFNLMASDVMIWHVPNDVEVSQWSNQSFLRYYTNTGFLNNYGGTLQSVFSKHFPMAKVSSISKTPRNQLVSVLSSLNGSASYIRSAISYFYNYTYDGGQNSISDGGNDMFDTGNKVYYQIGSGGYNQITYGQTYRDWTCNVVISSITGHPFIALMWIGNPNRSISSFDLKVVSNAGADGGGSISTRQGTIYHQSFELSYRIHNVYGATDASISQVFFYIKSNQLWDSLTSGSFSPISWSSETDDVTNTMRMNGSPRSVMMGYMLLSRPSGLEIDACEAKKALTRILQIISNFHDIDNYDCDRVAESLVVPVNYLEGSNDRVVSHMPPVTRIKNTPGYVHFRPLSHNGVPNALCSGFKTESCEPKFGCVGGINTRYYGDTRGCGDFAGWDGRTSIDQPNTTAPDRMAHSLNDIASSILIFTRSGNISNDNQH